MKLTKLIQTTWACPAQWEGEDEAGNFVYIRFRHGYLYVSIAPSEEEWDYKGIKIFEKVVTNEDLGEMSTEEMFEHTGLEYIGTDPIDFKLKDADGFLEWLKNRENNS